MSLVDWLVVVVGLGLIAYELWFFLGPRPRTAQRTGKGNTEVQEIRVLVSGGYSPDTIPVEVGKPVRLTFYRDETADCSGKLVFDTLGIERDLPPFEDTSVEFTPDTAGDYPFRCADSNLSGRVVAAEGGKGARAALGRGHDKHG